MWSVLMDLYNSSKELMLFGALVTGFALGFFIQRELHKDERSAMEAFTKAREE